MTYIDLNGSKYNLFEATGVSVELFHARSAGISEVKNKRGENSAR